MASFGVALNHCRLVLCLIETLVVLSGCRIVPLVCNQRIFTRGRVQSSMSTRVKLFRGNAEFRGFHRFFGHP